MAPPTARGIFFGGNWLVQCISAARDARHARYRGLAFLRTAGANVFEEMTIGRFAAGAQHNRKNPASRGRTRRPPPSESWPKAVELGGVIPATQKISTRSRRRPLWPRTH